MFYQHSGRPLIISVERKRLIYCACCRCPLSTFDKVLSSQFSSNSGPASLLDVVYFYFGFRFRYNITRAWRRCKQLVTGNYWISDIFCIICGQRLGWFYEFTQEEDQRPKFFLLTFLQNFND
ncbi:hypothetical protein HZS_6237 [Henneguya salminicola]|nr:hypothetical protein HZS_6237 [Henneguya salminicola]